MRQTNKQATSIKPASLPACVKGNSRQDAGPSRADSGATRADVPNGANKPLQTSTELRVATSTESRVLKVVGAVEQFEALAVDGAWYDAKVLGIVEERMDDSPARYTVRVEFQNCNQVITEELPLKHIRRRSETFRAGQFPQVGTTVLAFQQRKSYDLYYDADVIQVTLEPGTEPKILVQYLHGPEERMEEWLPLQALHRIHQKLVSAGELKAIVPCSIKAVSTENQMKAVKNMPGEQVPIASEKILANPAASGLAHSKGPPYKCCVCGKAFSHPPAHSSHERAHLQQLSSSERARLLHRKEADRPSQIASGPARVVPLQGTVDEPVSIVAEAAASRKMVEVQVVEKASADQRSKGKDANQRMSDAAPATEELQWSSVNEDKLDMKSILSTWKTADEEHVKAFKKKLRQKHPEVSADAKMCSDTQLLVDGSGVIRNKVVIDSAGEPALRACTEKERALTIKILSRQLRPVRWQAQNSSGREKYTRGSTYL